MKKFKTESARLMELMVNSIYTNKEIFLRELISNGSDAIDKRRFASLTDAALAAEYRIRLSPDKDARTITIDDNGLGMNAEDLENNLGTIASSGTFNFKAENKTDEQLIGQFGVGFYSAFMVAAKVTVLSKKCGEDKAYKWECCGLEGYTVAPAEKEEYGTSITLYLKEDDDDCKYSSFLEEWQLENLVKKYSDYIRYPIQMEVTAPQKKEDDTYEDVRQLKTLNSMVPLWKKPKNEVTKENYEDFYQSKYYDFTPPLQIIAANLEGTVSYTALLFIPGKTPYNYYSADYKKGIALYSNGVMVMESCGDIIPDYLGFVRGIVDSPDISLNISREMLQKDRQLKTIAASLEKKIVSELQKLQSSDRESYNKVFEQFGPSIKFGIYNNFGEKKDKLKDLAEFYCDGKLTTFKEYVEGSKDNEYIYYACGASVEAIDNMPKAQLLKMQGKKLLHLTDRIDEFVVKILGEYEGKKFKSISDSDFTAETEEQKQASQKTEEENKELFAYLAECLNGKVAKVIAADLGENAVAVTTEGELSLEMEKVLSSINGAAAPKAKRVLQLNAAGPIFARLKTLYLEDKDRVKPLMLALYNEALILEGMPVEDAAEFARVISMLIERA